MLGAAGIEWLTHLIPGYKREPRFDTGDFDERRVENVLRPKGHVQVSARQVPPRAAGRPAGREEER